MQIDFAGPIITAILALPGQFVQIVAANPGPWALVGLALLAVLVLAQASRRGRRRRAR